MVPLLLSLEFFVIVFLSYFVVFFFTLLFVLDSLLFDLIVQFSRYKFGGLKWARTTDLTLIRRVL